MIEDEMCPKCNGTGWYHYDHNHAKPCEVCCRHDQGVWQLLSSGYGDNQGKWCCLAGCGTVWDGIVDYQQAVKR